MVKHISKEEHYIDNLVNRVSGQYVKFIRHYEYSIGRLCGELDLLALQQNGMIDIYEVKASQAHLWKAKLQLARARKAFLNVDKCYAYVGLENRLIKEEDLL